MMETRSVSVGMAPHHQHQHQHQHQKQQQQHQQQQPHSILKKPPVVACAESAPVPSAQQTGQVQSPVAQMDLSGGGRGTTARPAQPPPAEFADITAQCYHPGGSIVGIVSGTSSTLPRPPPPPKCPRPDHHHHHHGGHHHQQQQHLHGTIRRHATGPSTNALPACTCSTGAAGGQLQPPHHTSSASLAADVAAAKTVAAAAAAAEELHV